jgi:aspartate kinase
VIQIFKFGGASVKDAEGVRNLAKVLKSVGSKNTLIIVSAMGKTTNAMEKIVSDYFDAKHELHSSVQEVKKYHNNIILDLFDNEEHAIFENIDNLFQELLQFFDNNKSPNYNFVYDQVVGFGELISTNIISHYLNTIGLVNSWLDVRNFIKTDDYYRNARVCWNKTQDLISKKVNISKLNITQGFIGSNSNNFTTTLGREGSDYTAAIFAFCLNAKSVTIWKDVPGVLNADPRFFENAELLSQISYAEAIELSYYGASVIHPKTLQPLQRKEIPLLVKSFLNPENKGTTVGKDLELFPKLPCYILKQNQILISLSSLDFSYIVEDNIRHIFELLNDYKMKVSMIQNSAISFSVCIENNYNNLNSFLLRLKANYKVKSYEGVKLYTVRHHNEAAVKEIEKGKEILLKQISPKIMQLITT